MTFNRLSNLQYINNLNQIIMFKNRITACMFTQNSDKDITFQEFESLLDGVYSENTYERTLDWVILRTDNKILQYSELSEHDWKKTLELWQMFAVNFTCYRVEVKYELSAKEIVIDMYDVDSSICIIINFNC